MNTFPWMPALVAGLVINVLDVAVTLLFAAKPWEAELRRQGLQPSPFTPPYYIATNFVGGILLTYTYLRFAESLGPGFTSAIAASLVMWSTTRIYGGGHVVMRQMPLWIFAIMSTGLGIGYVGAGQILRLILSRSTG